MNRKNLPAYLVIALCTLVILGWAYRVLRQPSVRPAEPSATTPPTALPAPSSSSPTVTELPTVPEDKPSQVLTGRLPNYLVIDIDTLSPDHVGAVRNGQPVTPSIDALATRGIRFQNAISQSGWTLPAVASLLTGALPVPMMLSGGAIPWRTDKARDLAEIMGIYGYTTSAFWQKTLAGGVLDQASKAFGSSSTKTDLLPTEEVRNWLGTAKEPFFAFVHEVDMNFPLVMPGPYEFDDPEWPASQSSYLMAYNQMAQKTGIERAQAAVLAHYDSVLHNYDAGIGKMVEVLASRGVADHTVIIVTSNHSQDFFDHTTIDHGLLYDTNLRIPLVVVDPESEYKGVTVDTVVQIVDIAPTILNRSGIPVAVSMIGQSLLPPPGHPKSTYQERPVFSMSDDCNASLRTREYKLMVRDWRTRQHVVQPPSSGGPPPPPEGEVRGVALAEFAGAHGIGDLPECLKVRLGGAAQKQSPATVNDLVLELYALQEDPKETRNLVGERPEVAVKMLPPLLRTMNAQREAGAAAPRNALRPEQVQQIQQQGYWELVEEKKKAP